MKQFKDWFFNKELNKVEFVYEETVVEVQPNLCDWCEKEFPIDEIIIVADATNDESINNCQFICKKCYSTRCVS